MNLEIQENAIQTAPVETAAPSFVVLDIEELDLVGGGYCVADY